jgi:hypothetical protein
VALQDYWRDQGERDRLLPALGELSKDGVVDRAGDWTALRTEVLTRLDKNGISSGTDLVKPLDEAVGRGGDFQALVKELLTEYETAAKPSAKAPAPTPVTTPPKPVPAAEPTTDEAFSAALPNVEELATAIVTELGEDLAKLLATEQFAGISEAELIDWIAEDIGSAIDEIGTHGWERLS